MTPVLGMICGCGRRVSAECPTVAEIGTVFAHFEGWGHDERGFVRCPECLAGGVPVPVPAAPQGDLFGRAAAC